MSTLNPAGDIYGSYITVGTTSMPPYINQYSYGSNYSNPYSTEAYLQYILQMVSQMSQDISELKNSMQLILGTKEVPKKIILP